jgi:hypothetical protein
MWVNLHRWHLQLAGPDGGLAFAHPPPSFTGGPPLRKESVMGLEEDIIKLLKNEGFKINEAIRDALDEFVDIVEEENEDMDEDLDDDDDEEEEDEE